MFVFVDNVTVGPAERYRGAPFDEDALGGPCPVIVRFAEVDAPTATSPKSSTNGSAISALGEMTGVGRVDGAGVVIVELRALP